MLALAGGVGVLAPHLVEPEVRELLDVIIAADDVAEADLALIALEGAVPQRVLVAALNLREMLRALPAAPCDMAVDADALARIHGMRHRKGELVRADGSGRAVVVRAEGNRCIDIVLRVNGARHYWRPSPASGMVVSDDVLAAVLDDPGLLDALVDLTIAMGLQFNPPIYLSLEDWHLDHAVETLERFSALFA